MLLISLTSLCAQLSSSSPPQPRFFPKFSRPVTLLDGLWDHGLVLGAFDSMNPEFKPADSLTPNKTAVPSCTDNAPPGFMGDRGVAMYETTFDGSVGVPQRLHFSACSFYCRVFVDGEEVGEHVAGGYVAFFLDVPAPSSTGPRKLFVLADNRFNKTTAPMQ